MARTAKTMTATAVASLRHPGNVNYSVVKAVGGAPGLLIQLAPGGGRCWMLRATIKGKRREIGLGPYEGMTLAQARDAATRIRLAITEGRDPLAEKRAARPRAPMTFAEAAKAWTASHRQGHGEKYSKTLSSVLETYAFPHLGDMPVADIKSLDVARTLKADDLWTKKTATAIRLRGAIEGVMGFATEAEERDGPNPAVWRGRLSHFLPKPASVAVAVPHPMVAVRDAPRFWQVLQAADAPERACLSLIVLTAVRSGNAREAEWSEFSLDEKLWKIPAEKMKAGEEFSVPLSSAAVGLLQSLPRINDRVFNSVRGGVLRDKRLSEFMKGLDFRDPKSGEASVPHGLRATFRSWINENGVFTYEEGEYAIAHTVGTKVARSYIRGDMLQRRFEMMNSWAAFLGAQ